MRLESGLGRNYDFFAPWSSRAVRKSPIDAEMQRLGIAVGRIRKKTSFGGVPVNFGDWPEVYDAYVRLVGNGFKDPFRGGLGARDYLDAIVEDKHAFSELYRIGSEGRDGGKAAFIRNAISDYRTSAQLDILADPQFARFAEHIRALQRQRDAAAMPLLEGGAP